MTFYACNFLMQISQNTQTVREKLASTLTAKQREWLEDTIEYVLKGRTGSYKPSQIQAGLAIYVQSKYVCMLPTRSITRAIDDH
jgi:predicted lipase